MSTLPYITSPGSIDKALNAIKSAAVPEKVTQDFVKTILKIPGGSGSQITTFIRKIGFTNSDGTPNEIYKKFRNPTFSGQAVAECIRSAYAPLYKRNEYMHKLNEDELVGLVVEETGQAHDSNPVKLTVNCIQRLKSFANFDEKPSPMVMEIEGSQSNNVDNKRELSPQKNNAASIGLNLGYTINLNLPATSDAAVFDAIFKSLKENLLRQDDA